MITPMALLHALGCWAGCVGSMRRMAAHLRKRCEPEIRALLDAYEQNPCRETGDPIDAYFWKHHSDLEAQGYMLWLEMAALHGNKADADRLEALSIYKKHATIPYGVLSGDPAAGTCYTLGNSSLLRAIGLIGFPRNRQIEQLFYSGGRYIVFYLSDYMPPDEDGYGAEEEYKGLCFDRFFRRRIGE